MVTTASANGNSNVDIGELRDLGSAVRARRGELTMTLQTLADRTGLSVPFLSQSCSSPGRHPPRSC
jgi:hypothetical protein